MRDVDEHIQLYVPLLRRIVVLVAVIIAVPVVLWTITAFVRTYVAPPKVPTFRSLAGQTFTEAAQNAAAQPGSPRSLAPAQPKAADPAPIVEARATTSDTNSDAPRGAYPGGSSQPAAPSGATAAPPAGPPAMPAAARTAALTATPAMAAPPSSTDDDLPAAGPITGRVPLPPHRPRLFAMAPTTTLAQTAASGIPVPRDRPVSAPDPTPVVPDAPIATSRDYNR
jgi:hypothetical protein